MKHRRRYTTRTSKKKAGQDRFTPAYGTARKGSSKFWRYLFIVIILVAGAYFIIEKLPKNDSAAADITVEAESAADEKQESAEEKTEQTFPVKAQEEDLGEQTIERAIQLEVLNGCGAQGVAKIFSRKLKKYQYDIVNSGNYLKRGKTYWKVPNTTIIDNTGSLESAEKLAEIMGVRKKFVKSKKTASPIADITIIVGKDYRDLKIVKKR